MSQYSPGSYLEVGINVFMVDKTSDQRSGGSQGLNKE